MRSGRSSALPALLVTIALLLALEAAARIYSPNTGGVLVERPLLALYAGIPHPEEVFSLLNAGCLDWAPYEHWRVRPNLHTRFYNTNSLGFRGRETPLEKPPGRFRVAVLGGSAAWGLGSTADDRSLPGRLETILRAEHPGRDIEVIDAGQPGFTSAQELIYFQRLISRLSPDLVLLFNGYNDVYADFLNAEPGWPQNALLLQSRYDDSFRHQWRRDIAALLRASRFLDLATRKIKTAAVQARGGPAASAIDPATTAAEYVRNVQAIARLAAPAPVWVALDPVLATIHKPLAPEERASLAAKEHAVAGYTERVRAAYRAIAGGVRAAGLPVIDLDDALGSKPELLFADECHFGDEAAARFAHTIAKDWKSVIQ